MLRVVQQVLRQRLGREQHVDNGMLFTIGANIRALFGQDIAVVLRSAIDMVQRDAQNARIFQGRGGLPNHQ